MKISPTVTLALPAYNEESRLEKTVATILNQTYTDFELLLGDNCSTDSTMEIMKRLAASDSRIRILPSERNVGAVANFARLLDEARGEFFAWVGAHDYYKSDWLSELVSVISHDEGIALVFPQCQRVSPDNTLIKSSSFHLDTRGMKPIERVKLLCGFPAAGERIYGLYRTSAAKKCPVTIVIRWDTLFLARLAFFGDMVSIDKCLWHRHYDIVIKNVYEMRLDALRRQYRVVYPEGEKISPLHWLPQLYHLLLLWKDGLKNTFRYGPSCLLLTWAGTWAYQKRGYKNLPCEFQCFFEQLKRSITRS